MNGLAARRQAERGDNTGADAAREAMEELRAVAGLTFLALLTGTGSAALLIGALMRLTEATAAAEMVHKRQLSAAMIREAHRQQDYAAGWDDCLAFLAGQRLHAV